MGGLVDGWMGGCLDVWMACWLAGWLDGWMDDGLLCVYRLQLMGADILSESEMDRHNER